MFEKNYNILIIKLWSHLGCYISALNHKTCTPLPTKKEKENRRPVKNQKEKKGSNQQKVNEDMKKTKKSGNIEWPKKKKIYGMNRSLKKKKKKKAYKSEYPHPSTQKEKLKKKNKKKKKNKLWFLLVSLVSIYILSAKNKTGLFFKNNCQCFIFFKNLFSFKIFSWMFSKHFVRVCFFSFCLWLFCLQKIIINP